VSWSAVSFVVDAEVGSSSMGAGSLVSRQRQTRASTATACDGEHGWRGLSAVAAGETVAERMVSRTAPGQRDDRAGVDGAAAGSGSGSGSRFGSGRRYCCCRRGDCCHWCARVHQSLGQVAAPAGHHGRSLAIDWRLVCLGLQVQGNRCQTAGPPACADVQSSCPGLCSTPVCVVAVPVSRICLEIRSLENV
jgi:hypothetical protein